MEFGEVIILVGLILSAPFLAIYLTLYVLNWRNREELIWESVYSFSAWLLTMLFSIYIALNGFGHVWLVTLAQLCVYTFIGSLIMSRTKHFGRLFEAPAHDESKLVPHAAMTSSIVGIAATSCFWATYFLVSAIAKPDLYFSDVIW